MADYDWVLETTSGIPQTWTKSFLKQIIKATVLTWQWKMNFKLCSFSQTLWRLNLINISYRFAYWWSNVHGLKSHWKRVFTYKVRSFDVGEPCLGNLVYCLLKTKIFQYSGTHKLHITADRSYHGLTSLN